MIRPQQGSTQWGTLLWALTTRTTAQIILNGSFFSQSLTFRSVPIFSSSLAIALWFVLSIVIHPGHTQCEYLSTFSSAGVKLVDRWKTYFVPLLSGLVFRRHSSNTLATLSIDHSIQSQAFITKVFDPFKLNLTFCLQIHGEVASVTLFYHG